MLTLQRNRDLSQMASSSSAGPQPPAYFMPAGKQEENAHSIQAGAGGGSAGATYPNMMSASGMSGTNMMSGVVSGQQPLQVGLYPSGQLGLQTQYVSGLGSPGGVMFTAQPQTQAVYLPVPTNLQPQLIALSPSYGCTLCI